MSKADDESLTNHQQHSLHQFPTSIPIHGVDGQPNTPPPRYNFIPTKQTPKSVLEAYLLAIPLGILGAHHFYLRRPGFGFLYFFTFGLLGVGVLVDWIRLPCLVKEANRHLEEPIFSHNRKRVDDTYIIWFTFGLLGFHRFYLGEVAMGFLCLFTCNFFGIGWLVDIFLIPSYVNKANLQNETDPEKSLPLAYALATWPITGVLGGHHFYLKRYLFGVIYFFTFGLLGVGWFFDFFRMPCLVRRKNKQIRENNDDPKKTLDDAYILWFPLGITGFHHFYLNRPCWGILYFFTFGIFGFGWLLDLFRIPSLLKNCNNEIEAKHYIIKSNQQTGGAACYEGYPVANRRPLMYEQPLPQDNPNYGSHACTTNHVHGITFPDTNYREPLPPPSSGVVRLHGNTSTLYYNEPPPPYAS